MVPKDQAGTEPGTTLKPYSPLQLLFLLRLVRMLRLKQKHDSPEGSDARLVDLLNKAIYSTFCDCLEQGVGSEARSLMAKSVARPEA